MTQQWKEFQGRRSAADLEEPAITVQKGGTLGINYSAWLALGKPKRVRYVKAEDTPGRFGIIPVEAETPNSYGLRAQTSGRSHVVTATLFLKWAGIPHDTARVYTLRMEDGVGVVDTKTK